MASKTDDLACSRSKCLSKLEARTAILDFDSHQKEAALLEEHFCQILCVLERSKQIYFLVNHTKGQTSWKSKAKSNNISAENLDRYFWQIQRRQLQ